MEKTSRRDAIKKLGAVLGMGISIPVVSTYLTSCSDDSSGPSTADFELNLNNVQGIENPGSIVKIQNKTDNGPAELFLIRESQTEFLVLSTECTHQGCLLNLPDEDNDNIWCACHGSVFSKDNGTVLGGPANAPLPEYSSNFNTQSNILTITV